MKIYVDNAATTAVSDVALNAMLPYFKECYGNPSAIHSFGNEARQAVEDARHQIASSLGARVNEIFFTSGGTESDNWALFAAGELRKKKGRHIVTTQIEHSAIYKTALEMAKNGYEVTFLPVDRYGHITPEQVEAAIRSDTILVSVMTANNEIGTLQPIKELADAAHRHGVLFHTDAVQAVGHVPIDVKKLGVDMLSVSSHKFQGPKGVGILYINIRTLAPPLIIGGGQEKGRRSGTSNVPGMVGMAAALHEAVGHMDENIKTVSAMRDKLITELTKLPGVELTGDPVNRLPGIASFLVGGVEAEPLVRALNEAGICLSSGSACSAASVEPSRVLKAIRSERELKNAAPIRISLCERNTPEEMEYIITQFPAAIKKAAEPRVKFISPNINLDDY